MTQINMIIDMVKTNGDVTVDQVVKAIKQTGAVSDPGLVHARVCEINKTLKHRQELGSKLATYNRTTKYGVETVITRTMDLKTVRVPPVKNKTKKAR